MTIHCAAQLTRWEAAKQWLCGVAWYQKAGETTFMLSNYLHRQE
ncbi:hypothetical protein [Catalinimonas niigatensis]|nr:hypothetical protein [Catalinimonas niigatensis]WPP49473.1 hypothetical protein PZB72_22645 [Catalinimonas niigatensis]